MASAVKVPANVSSITFSVSGVLTPVNQIISGLTPTELTALVYNEDATTHIISVDPNTGASKVQLPSTYITSITINGNIYIPDVNGVITILTDLDASNFLNSTYDHTFTLVTGA